MSKQKDQKRNTSATRAASRTVERRMERERQRRRQRLIITAVVIGAVALIVAVALILANQPSEAPIPEAAARYEGISMSRTTEGYPRLGDPDAPVQVAEYSSFGCVACKAFHDAAIDPIVERVRSGNVAFTYVPLWQTGTVSNAQGAARAGVCAAEQSAFWHLHDAFFEWQSVFGNQAFTNSRILSGVNALDLDRGAYDNCINSGRSVDVLNRAQQQASALVNFVGTPTITINGVVPVDSAGNPFTDPGEILEAIDRAIAAAEERRQPAEATETPEATPTAEATSEPSEEVTPEVTDVPEIEATVEATAEVTPEATEEGS